MYDALKGADALIIATEWNEFRAPNIERISEALKNELIFDGRNVFNLDKMEDLGYTYYSIGRKTIIK
jgi:UDPglucose 6-dehydrogenase